MLLIGVLKNIETASSGARLVGVSKGDKVCINSSGNLIHDGSRSCIGHPENHQFPRITDLYYEGIITDINETHAIVHCDFNVNAPDETSAWQKTYKVFT